MSDLGFMDAAFRAARPRAMGALLRYCPFLALSEGGKVSFPVHDAFWGAKFGMLVDPFGVQWMLIYEQAAPVKS